MSSPSVRRALSVALVLAAAACSGSAGVVPPASTSTTATTTTATTATTTPPPALCPRNNLRPAATYSEVRSLSADDPAAAAVQIARDRFECAAEVVVVAPGDLVRVALAARLAAARQAPLLFAGTAASPALDAALAGLIPQRVLLVGGGFSAPEVPDGTEVERLGGDAEDLAAAANALAADGPALTLPEGDGAALVAVAVRAMVEGTALEPSPASITTTTGAASSSTSTTIAGGEGPAEEEVVPSVLVGTGDAGVAWLVDAGSPAIALAAAASAVHSGGLMALVDGDDLRRLPEVGRALRAARNEVVQVRLVGEVTADASWQVPLLLEGEELPGGGYLLFPGRRLVALYGHAWAPELGAMGEQPPAAAVERVAPIAAEYAEEGVAVVPAFEIIATVADSRAGDDGNYSNETPVGDIRPWVEAAGAAGMYVLLDLQPGRTDFPAQALLYEEFLRLPYVGLALDPEWRLGPDQFHLQQFGSVSAAEVNAVADWLAGLVREEHLPQKMLLLHQFRLSMVPDREDIVVPPELALVIQMDGQGALEDKYATWAAVTAGTEGSGWSWGWKNFYDEDAPMATPAEVLALVPAVVYVSYQ